MNLTIILPQPHSTSSEATYTIELENHRLFPWFTVSKLNILNCPYSYETQQEGSQAAWFVATQVVTLPLNKLGMYVHTIRPCAYYTHMYLGMCKRYTSSYINIYTYIVITIIVIIIIIIIIIIHIHIYIYKYIYMYTYTCVHLDVCIHILHLWGINTESSPSSQRVVSPQALS